MTTATWTVYFDDGTSYSSLDGPASDVPFKRIVCITNKPNQYTLYYYTDWYYWNIELQTWWSSDTFGLLYQLCRNAANIGVVRKGNIGAENFNQAMLDAFVSRMT